MECCSRHGLRRRFQGTIIMQISVLFAYCSGRNFNDTDPPLLIYPPPPDFRMRDWTER